MGSSAKWAISNPKEQAAIGRPITKTKHTWFTHNDNGNDRHQIYHQPAEDIVFKRYWSPCPVGVRLSVVNRLQAM